MTMNYGMDIYEETHFNNEASDGIRFGGTLEGCGHGFSGGARRSHWSAGELRNGPSERSTCQVTDHDRAADDDIMARIAVDDADDHDDDYYHCCGYSSSFNPQQRQLGVVHSRRWALVGVCIGVRCVLVCQWDQL